MTSNGIHTVRDSERDNGATVARNGTSKSPTAGGGRVANAFKSLWASVQGDPAFMRKVNGWFTFLWIAMIPISIFLGLLSSVAYVSALSLWALVSGHWSAWQAARVEVEQAAEKQELAENPVEDRVVEQIVAKTEISPAHAATLKSRASTDAKLDAILQRLADVEQNVSRRLQRNPSNTTAQ